MTAGRATIALAGAAALAGSHGCRDDGAWSAEQDRASVSVDDANVSVQTGPVGQGEWKRDATYALVDAKNTGDRDLSVTLAGELTSAGGEALGELRSESLRVPAGGQRTFALVDEAGEVRADAASASIRVAGAAVVGYEPPLVITDGRVYDDRDHRGRERVVVAGRVDNRAERRGRVSVMAAFYDEDGAPIERPFAVLAVGGGERRPVRFVGPPGSRRAYLFVGTATF